MAKILIIANFCDAYSLKGRFTYLADLLVSMGHEVEIVTSDFNHGSKSAKQLKNMSTSYKITHIHEPGYPGNVSLKRLWSHRVWGKNVKKYLESLNYKPDVIYCPIPSLTATRYAGLYCKKNGMKFITDIQDLWPEAFALVVKNKTLANLAFYPFSKFADSVYKLSDKVVGVSDTYKERALKVCDKNIPGLTVYLGNDGETFDNAKKDYAIAKPKDEFWLAYIGTLGYSYDLNCVIDAIAEINATNSACQKIKFIVMGDGPFKNEFEAHAQEKGVDAVFTGALPYQEMVGRMCSCDVVMNSIRKNAAQSITNKVGDYALSGLPVINTQENPEYRKIIEEYNCGINCEVGNSHEVAEAIIRLMKDDELRIAMGKNHRKLGIERFDRRTTYPHLAEFIISE